jgi:3-phosphoshikimate 1-carboxyvinyltransferase
VCAKLRITPSSVAGTVQVPRSKSHSIRALLAAGFASGVSEVEGLLQSSDLTYLVAYLSAIGAKVEQSGAVWKIQGVGGQALAAVNSIQVGGSGLLLRFLTAMASHHHGRHQALGGIDSLNDQRPMGDLLQGLAQRGVAVCGRMDSTRAPVEIQGGFKPGHVTVMGDDSQTVSALLFASAWARGVTQIEVTQPGEHAWVDLTCGWLDRLQIDYQRCGYQNYKVHGRGGWDGFEFSVPADWSSAAFPIVCGLLYTDSEVIIRGLDRVCDQGDQQIIKALQQMNVTVMLADTIQVSCQREMLQAATLDLSNLIDALPIMAVVAAYTPGKTVLTGIAGARDKECNRLLAMQQELGKMGVEIHIEGDAMMIQGGKLLKGARVDSHGDHRVALALAVAAMGATGETIISNVTCIEKTYPGFISDMNHIGAKMEIIDE